MSFVKTPSGQLLALPESAMFPGTWTKNVGKNQMDHQEQSVDPNFVVSKAFFPLNLTIVLYIAELAEYITIDFAKKK